MADERKYVRYQPVPYVQKARGFDADSVKSQEQRCSSCGYWNTGLASFCADCGAFLRTPATCPKCSAAVLPDADICEACGSWLLEGLCTFCAAPVAESQAYCGNCGNPAAGIACPRCGQSSIFDFCGTCAIPLSNQARELARAAALDPAQQKLATLLGELHELQNDPQTVADIGKDHRNTMGADDDQLRKMKLARAPLPAPSTPQYAIAQSKSLFSDEQKKRISLLGEQIIKEEERQRLEKERLRLEAERKRLEQEERRRRLQEEINQALSRLAGKTFSSSQDARRFFMSMVSALPEEAMQAVNAAGRLRWRCHAYSNEHDSPAGCADPSQGGVWLIS